MANINFKSSYTTLKLILFVSVFFVYGCTSSEKVSKELEEEVLTEESKKDETVFENPLELTELIFRTAAMEQDNKMYSRNHDSTYLYWLNDHLLILKNTSKCNIFAINTLHRAGFKTPNVNVLTHDLMDVTRFNDIFPVIDVKHYSEIMSGDLVVWFGHVIIFERLLKMNDRYFAQAWWAGTRQQDNGSNIRNNVIYGRYPLDKEFIVRRPLFPGM